MTIQTKIGAVLPVSDRTNTHNVVDPNMPFGDYKQSGIGREHGAIAVENYLETKAICLALQLKTSAIHLTRAAN